MAGYFGHKGKFSKYHEQSRLLEVELFLAFSILLYHRETSFLKLKSMPSNLDFQSF
jgi:hypothetical protein